MAKGFDFNSYPEAPSERDITAVAPPQGQQAGLEDIVRPFMQGATLGTSDEMIGALRAGKQALTGEIPLNIESLKKAYKEERDVERQANKESSEANPGTYKSLELLSSLISPIGLGGKAVKGAGIGIKALKTALGGAALGGVAGAGYSEGETPSEVAKDTALGAGMGALPGAALGGLGVISKVAKNVPVPIFSKVAGGLEQGLAGNAPGQTKLTENVEDLLSKVAEKQNSIKPTIKVPIEQPPINEGLLPEYTNFGRNISKIEPKFETVMNPKYAPLFNTLKQLGINPKSLMTVNQATGESVVNPKAIKTVQTILKQAGEEKMGAGPAKKSLDLFGQGLKASGVPSNMKNLVEKAHTSGQFETVGGKFGGLLGTGAEKFLKAEPTAKALATAPEAVDLYNKEPRNSYELSRDLKDADNNDLRDVAATAHQIPGLENQAKKLDNAIEKEDYRTTNQILHDLLQRPNFRRSLEEK